MENLIIKEKRKYVESLNEMLAPMQDFDSIKYANDAITSGEYVKIADTLGGYVYLDVTAMDLEGILKDVARVILSDELGSEYPKSLIHDKQKLREIAPLFRPKTDCPWK